MTRINNIKSNDVESSKLLAIGKRIFSSHVRLEKHQYSPTSTCTTFRGIMGRFKVVIYSTSSHIDFN
jgi:hypothetical protein